MGKDHDFCGMIQLNNKDHRSSITKPGKKAKGKNAVKMRGQTPKKQKRQMKIKKG